MVQMLLDKGASVNAQGGEYGSALQAASEGGHGQVSNPRLPDAISNSVLGWIVRNICTVRRS